MQGRPDDELSPPKPPVNPDSPLGRILGRDRRFYAALWAPAYIPGFTAEDLLDDPDPVEREAGARIYEAFVRDMQFDCSGEDYRLVVEEHIRPWGSHLDLEQYALTWRPKSHAQIVRELVEHEKRERQAKRAHLRVVYLGSRPEGDRP